MDKLLEKIKGDFFPIMAPGVYILCILGVIALSLIDEGKHLKWIGLIKSSRNWNDYWPLYILALFLAYLIGHFLRAIPVSLADKICKSVFWWTTKKSGLVRIYYETNFPYHDALVRLLTNLQEDGYPEDVFYAPHKKTVHTAFNFFKAVLCSEAPNAFAYTQTLEARVRLFAGMFWSACFGILACLLFACSLAFNHCIQWTGLHTGMLVSSVIIAALLGGQLPRVRGQEVEYVFLFLPGVFKKSRNESKYDATNLMALMTASFTTRFRYPLAMRSISSPGADLSRVPEISMHVYLNAGRPP